MRRRAGCRAAPRAYGLPLGTVGEPARAAGPRRGVRRCAATPYRRAARPGASCGSARRCPSPHREQRHVDPSRSADRPASAALLTARISGRCVHPLSAAARARLRRRYPTPSCVRAVEELACPLVLPNDGAATQGNVVAHLRQGGTYGGSRSPAGPARTRSIRSSRCWTGCGRGRSPATAAGRSPATRLSVAQAAVHLAATLVQLLGADALTRRASRDPLAVRCAPKHCGQPGCWPRSGTAVPGSPPRIPRLSRRNHPVDAAIREYDDHLVPVAGHRQLRDAVCDFAADSRVRTTSPTTPPKHRALQLVLHTSDLPAQVTAASSPRLSEARPAQGSARAPERRPPGPVRRNRHRCN
jgi:hypothetical protein